MNIEQLKENELYRHKRTMAMIEAAGNYDGDDVSFIDYNTIFMEDVETFRKARNQAKKLLRNYKLKSYYLAGDDRLAVIFRGEFDVATYVPVSELEKINPNCRIETNIIEEKQVVCEIK